LGGGFQLDIKPDAESVHMWRTSFVAWTEPLT